MCGFLPAVWFTEPLEKLRVVNDFFLLIFNSQTQLSIIMLYCTRWQTNHTFYNFEESVSPVFIISIYDRSFTNNFQQFFLFWILKHQYLFLSL